MRTLIWMLASAIALTSVFFFVLQVTEEPEPASSEPAPISSRVVKTDAGERVLIQEAVIDAPVDQVWQAYTTSDGWTAWASPQAEIDLRVGGTIRTRYDDGEIGAPGTNTLHIVNYVPRQVLTLRAEMTKNFPAVLKNDADKLSNVIVFERLGSSRTRIQSYGIGYSDSPEVQSVLDFFVDANEKTLGQLRNYLETGERASFGS